MGNCYGSDKRKKRPRLPATAPQKMRWTLGKLIGKGVYSIVYECLNSETGEIHAVKHIPLSGSLEDVKRDFAKLRQEINVISELSHENVVRYLQIEMTEDMNGVYIISERASGLSVRDMLLKFKKTPESLVRIYIYQVLQGLSYLHKVGIIHRDIKCSNLLVNEDGTLKLSDFGAYRRIVEGESRYSLKGSPYWMAPEVAKRTGHSFPADIWSVGCTVIEMMTGKPPWATRGLNTCELIDLLCKTNAPPELPSDASKQCQNFLEMCLQIDPSKRYTASKLLEHPFFNDTREVRCDLS